MTRGKRLAPIPPDELDAAGLGACGAGALGGPGRSIRRLLASVEMERGDRAEEAAGLLRR